MNWVDLFPIVFLPLKLIVLGVGMFYSIKWHHDMDKKEREEAEKSDDYAPTEEADNLGSEFQR